VLDALIDAAATPGITAELAEALAADEHLAVRRAVAANPDTPSRVLAALAGGDVPPADVCGECDGRPDCDHRAAHIEVLVALTGNPSTPGRLLHALADHPSPAVRQALAARTKYGSSHR
jgi:Leucine rich repeat variant